MAKCAKFAGRDPETCTRGQACHCLNEPFGNSEQLECLIRAYAEDCGWSVEFIRASLNEMPNGQGLVRWDDFRRGFSAGANAAIEAIEASQPPDTTPWDCVDSVRKKLGLPENRHD